MLSVVVHQFINLENIKQFSFSYLNFTSDYFIKEEDCLISLLKHCLQQQSLLIHIHGLSPSISHKIDAAFGQSFKLKFRFANAKLDTFIDFCFQQEEKKTHFFLKLTSLIAPFYKVTYESPDIIVLKLPDQTNPEVQQFFDSKVFFQSDNWNYKYQPGDITFFSDASCETHSTLAGAALQNKHMICSFRKIIAYEDNNLAELKAVLETIYLAQFMDCKDLVLYTDNANAIDFLSGKSKITEKNEHFFHVVEEIKNLLPAFNSFYIAWIPRKKNLLADNLSKYDFNGLFFHR